MASRYFNEFLNILKNKYKYQDETVCKLFMKADVEEFIYEGVSTTLFTGDISLHYDGNVISEFSSSQYSPSEIAKMTDEYIKTLEPKIKYNGSSAEVKTSVSEMIRQRFHDYRKDGYPGMDYELLELMETIPEDKMIPLFSCAGHLTCDERIENEVFIKEGTFYILFIVKDMDWVNDLFTYLNEKLTEEDELEFNKLTLETRRMDLFLEIDLNHGIEDNENKRKDFYQKYYQIE